MAEILFNTRIFAGGVDLTSVSNQVAVEATVEKRDVTPFGGDGWKEYKGGIKSGSFKAQGFWEAGGTDKVDDYQWSKLGLAGPWSVYDSTDLSPAASAGVGTSCYFTDGLHSSYKIFDKVGEVAPWSGDVESTWPVVRGVSMHPPGTARIATGVAPGVEKGPIPAGQGLYAALHVLSVAGTASPSITVKVESDIDDSWASSIDQITFTPATARGGEIKRSLGPITDNWYRVSWTITGTSPSFLFVVSLGVA